MCYIVAVFLRMLFAARRRRRRPALWREEDEDEEQHNNMQGRLQTVVYLDSYQETQNDMSLAVAMKDTQFAVVNQSDFA
ncbi:UNVERIFIED_CONTAM: hypothetical protein FKN15_044780 [Acipenser sinensis]